MGSPPDGKRPQGLAVRVLKRRVPVRIGQKAAIAGELAQKPAVCFFAGRQCYPLEGALERTEAGTVFF